MKDVENLNIRDVAGGAVIAVKVVPGSSRDRVAGVLGDALKIATASVAEKGNANKAVAKTLAKTLSLDVRNVTLIAGPKNPQKEFAVAGETAETIRQRLAKI